MNPPGNTQERLPPGQGVVPFAQILPIIAAKGYSGYLSYEALHPVAPLRAIRSRWLPRRWPPAARWGNAGRSGRRDRRRVDLAPVLLDPLADGGELVEVDRLDDVRAGASRVGRRDVRRFG